MLLHHYYNTCQLSPRKAAALLKSDWIEPDLGPICVALDMHVRRLCAVASEEEETIRTNTENRRNSETFSVRAPLASCATLAT